MGGPVYFVFLAYIVTVAALSVWVMFDVMRAKRSTAFARAPWSRWAWFAPQALFFVVFVVESLPWTANAFLGMVLVLSSPFALVAQVVYLLRVAYPTAERLAARELAAATLRTVPAQEDSPGRAEALGYNPTQPPVRTEE